MQLGTRWRAGDPPHASVPASLHSPIALQEAAHPEGRAWTLTWLEGLAQCALDDLVLVRETHRGEVLVSTLRQDRATDEPDGDIDDDDWLK